MEFMVSLVETRLIYRLLKVPSGKSSFANVSISQALTIIFPVNVFSTPLLSLQVTISAIFFLNPSFLTLIEVTVWFNKSSPPFFLKFSPNEAEKAPPPPVGYHAPSI